MHFLPKGNISSKRQFSLLSIKHVMPFIIMVKILLFIEVSLTQREQALNTPWSRLYHSFVYLWSPTILLYMWSPTMPCSSTVIKTDIASSQIFCRGGSQTQDQRKVAASSTEWERKIKSWLLANPWVYQFWSPGISWFTLWSDWSWTITITAF